MANQPPGSNIAEQTGIIPSGQDLLGYGAWALKGVTEVIQDSTKIIQTEVENKLGSDTDANLSKINDLTLGQSTYDFNSRVFPIDIGDTSYNRHYMVININVSNYSNFDRVSGPGGVNVQNFTRLSGDLSKVDALRSAIDKQYSSGGQTLGVGFYAPRQTRRIAESIALFMPNTVAYTSANEYEDVSLTDILEKGVRTVLPSIAGSILDVGKTASKVLHAPINPRVEVIFSNTDLRQFTFDFLFAPSNEQESKAIKQIIQTLRFHAAPEFNGLNWDLNSLKSLLWIPPSEFDITFYYQGQENTNIPRINTCVCSQIDVDYAPSGIYSTFANGHPVQIRMQMKLHETEILHKLRVMQGF